MSRVMPAMVLSQWSTMVDGLKQSAKDFYAETYLNLEKHQLTSVKCEIVVFPEGGIFSARREYLQIRYREFVYHVCAAPYGNGFFVSSWLGDVDNWFLEILDSIPVLGIVIRFLIRVLKPLTFYRFDTAQMFHTVVHDAVTKTLDRVIHVRGLRALTESERKPAMRDIFAQLK